MNSVRKKQSSVSNSSDSGFLVINNSNGNSTNSKNGFNDNMNASTPNKSRPTSSKSMYQTPSITGSGAAIKPQYINTQDFNSNIKQQKSALNIAVSSPFDYQYGSYLIPSNLMTPYSANLHKKPNNSYFAEAESSFNNNNSTLADVNDTFENMKEGKKRSITSANNSMFFAPPVRPAMSMRTSSSSSSMFTKVSKPFFSNDLTKDEMLMGGSSSRNSVQIDNLYPSNGPFSHINENTNIHLTTVSGLDSTFKLKINYSYTFSSTNSFNSIVFSNLNDDLTISYFLSKIEMLEPFGKIAVKDTLSFKIVKDGRKDINTFIINFYSLDALQYFNERFVADLVKYKRLFNSKHLILRKCHLESNILSNVKNDVLNLQIGNRLQFINDDDVNNLKAVNGQSNRNLALNTTANFEDDDGLTKEINLSDRFLIVDAVNIDSVLKILTLKESANSSEENSNNQVFLKVQNIFKIRNPAFKKDETPEHALMLVFDNGNIKQLAVHMFGAYEYGADEKKVNIYNVKRIHMKNQDAEDIEQTSKNDQLDNEENVSVIESKSSADETKSQVSSLSDKKEQYIKVLDYDGHLQASAFSDHAYNKDSVNSKLKNVKLLQNTIYQKIIFKKKPTSLHDVDQLNFSSQNNAINSTLNDEDGQDIHETDQTHDIINDEGVSPTNGSSQSSLPLFYECTAFDETSRGTSVSGFVPFPEDNPELRKLNYTNRLIFISNLPPVVKIFDLVNVIRGGLIEQIRFVQGQKFCFVKFILPSSANLFYDCCKLRPVILHGFQLNVDFGKKGLELPPVTPGLLMKISKGATRNVYLSLPEFAYKKIYTKDKRYSKFKKFRLPSPEDMIADFGNYFGPLEQINFAKDNHCCWINFMSIHSAIRLMKALEKDTAEFHETFQNKYLGLIFKFGKDRCEKLPKDVYQ